MHGIIPTTILASTHYMHTILHTASSETLASYAPDEATFPALQGKHPPLHPSAIPSLQEGFLPHPIQVMAKDIAKAIHFFHNGLAGGPDDFKPQHLKDIISPSLHTVGLPLKARTSTWVLIKTPCPGSIVPRSL